MIPYLGHITALATSVVWSITSILFTYGGNRVGSTVVNRTRLLIATTCTILLHWAIQGQWVPTGAEPFRWGWLSVSGVIGFMIGDACLFQALVMIGPRLAMLLMALAPVISALLGWGLLHETLEIYEWIGILVAVGGTALVVSDQQTHSDENAQDNTLPTPRRYGWGIALGLGAAAGQAIGLMASKIGLQGGFPALSGNVIRLMAATAAIWVLALLQRRIRSNFVRLKEHPKALWAIAAGAMTGPVIGVWLSLTSIQHAPLGVASTLMSLMPIFLLPVGHFFFNERIGWRAIVGTLVTFAGTAILFL